MMVGSRSTAEGEVDWDKPIAPCRVPLTTSRETAHDAPRHSKGVKPGQRDSGQPGPDFLYVSLSMTWCGFR